MYNHELHPFQQRIVTRPSQRPKKPDARSVATRRRIEDIKEQRALEEAMKL